MWLRGVLLPLDARWQHIVDRQLVVVLLDADGGCGEGAGLCGGIVEVLRIDPPRAAHEVEGGKAQHHGLGETREEHTHETDAGEVADAAHPFLILVYGNTEEVPREGLHALTRARCRVALVHDEVLADLEILGPDGEMILVVFLVFVEGVVLVDILHIRSALVRGVVGLRAVVGVGGVA